MVPSCFSRPFSSAAAAHSSSSSSAGASASALSLASNVGAPAAAQVAVRPPKGISNVGSKNCTQISATLQALAAIPELVGLLSSPAFEARLGQLSNGNVARELRDVFRGLFDTTSHGPTISQALFGGTLARFRAKLNDGQYDAAAFLDFVVAELDAIPAAEVAAAAGDMQVNAGVRAGSIADCFKSRVERTVTCSGAGGCDKVTTSTVIVSQILLPVPILPASPQLVLVHLPGGRRCQQWDVVLQQPGAQGTPMRADDVACAVSSRLANGIASGALVRLLARKWQTTEGKDFILRDADMIPMDDHRAPYQEVIVTSGTKPAVLRLAFEGPDGVRMAGSRLILTDSAANVCAQTVDLLSELTELTPTQVGGQLRIHYERATIYSNGRCAANASCVQGQSSCGGCSITVSGNSVLKVTLVRCVLSGTLYEQWAHCLVCRVAAFVVRLCLYASHFLRINSPFCLLATTRSENSMPRSMNRSATRLCGHRPQPWRRALPCGRPAARPSAPSASRRRPP